MGKDCFARISSSSDQHTSSVGATPQISVIFTSATTNSTTTPASNKQPWVTPPSFQPPLPEATIIFASIGLFWYDWARR
ncbi:hypothetical protein HanIR_Chr15g0768981 [Helianthus annuus]|nr:hypothetical protein HanIR_Chr15g0768981 [Helianthus annuus]